MQKFLKTCFSILWFGVVSNTAFAWDSPGHRVISTIAYNHLTSVTKQKIDALTELLDPGYAPQDRFLYVAVLPDQWRKNKADVTASWHYDDAPWSTDGAKTVAATSPNLFSELARNQAILQGANATLKNKALALAYVTHLVEDAHQPLHCINLFSKEFSDGDLGGNRFKIQNAYAHNLHAYWDQSLRLWMQPHAHYPPTNKKIRRIAEEIQQQYPEDSFGSEAHNLDFQQWQRQCYKLAQTIAYQTTPNHKLSANYIATVKDSAGKQIALAGYRLAEMLNVSN